MTWTWTRMTTRPRSTRVTTCTARTCASVSPRSRRRRRTKTRRRKRTRRGTGILRGSSLQGNNLRRDSSRCRGRSSSPRRACRRSRLPPLRRPSSRLCVLPSPSPAWAEPAPDSPPSQCAPRARWPVPRLPLFQLVRPSRHRCRNRPSRFPSRRARSPSAAPWW